MTQCKKTALKERVRELEEELMSLQAQFDSEKTTLISKEEHKKFIDEVHSMHKQEVSRLKQLHENLQQQITLQQQKIAQTQASLDEEKSKSANIFNELHYNKMENSKHVKQLKDAQVQLMAAKKSEEMLKEREVELQRSLKILDELKQEKKRNETAHRDTVMDLNGKLNEKDSLIQQSKQIQEKMKEREK